jgi:hypothetical protein
MNIGTKLMTVSMEEAEMREFPTYTSSGNTPHTLLDLSKMTKEEHPDHTVSIKLPNGHSLTINIIPFWMMDNGESGSVDIKYHGKGDTVVLPLDTNGDRRVAAENNLYSVEYKKHMEDK